MGGHGSEYLKSCLERYSRASWEIVPLLFAEAERTERATPRKRRRVREEGRVPVSRELNMAITFLIFAVVLKIFGPQGIASIARDVSAFLSLEETEDLLSALGYFKDILLMIGALMLFTMAAGILVGAIQTRFLLAFKTLRPDLNRINPVEGFKRLFSLRSVVELLKAVMKVVVIGVVVYQVLKDRWYEMVLLSDMELEDAFLNLWDVASEVSLKSGIALLALAVFDYAYQRWDYEKSIRMTEGRVQGSRRKP